MEYIHFIINPIAGSGNTAITNDFLHQYFDKESYTLQVKYSEYKKHAIALTKESIKDGAAIIVACGGDGTINEVASCIVNTDIILGIIPIGSGNGLASNLRIPKDVFKAITLIKKRTTTQIDVGVFNNKYFFSNTGVGFDASVIKNYEALEKRTLQCYIKASLKSFRDLSNKEEVEINIDGIYSLINPFMIFVSNSNELGYNVSLTPKASLQDGLLDVLVIPKMSKLKVLWFGILVFLKRHHLIKAIKSYQVKSIKLTRNKGNIFESQMDGESYMIEDKTISIMIKEKSLNVIVSE